MAQPDLSILLPEEWDYDILEDGRIVIQARGRRNTYITVSMDATSRYLEKK